MAWALNLNQALVIRLTPAWDRRQGKSVALRLMMAWDIQVLGRRLVVASALRLKQRHRLPAWVLRLVMALKLRLTLAWDLREGLALHQLKAIRTFSQNPCRNGLMRTALQLPR